MIKPNKVEWCQRAIAGLSSLKPKDKLWMLKMTKDDFYRWASDEYDRHYKQEETK